MEALLAVYDSVGLGLLCLNKHAAVPNRTDGRAVISLTGHRLHPRRRQKNSLVCRNR